MVRPIDHVARFLRVLGWRGGDGMTALEWIAVGTIVLAVVIVIAWTVFAIVALRDRP